jgi:hypothetical protein
MKVGQANGLGMELIEVGCLNDGISMTGEISIALVISHKDNHIRPFSGPSKYG